MTRKEALLSVIAELEAKNGYKDEVEKLKEIMDIMPFIRWDDATVKDSVEYFMLKTGRLPTVFDFLSENELPSNPVIKQHYGVNLREWLDDNFPTYYKPKTTRKQALLIACESVQDNQEVVEKIEQLIDEYPTCRWNCENILDGLHDFYRINQRLPYEKEFIKKNHLPDYKHILYKYERGLHAFYSHYCPDLFERCKNNIRPVRNYLDEFKLEYEVVRPYSKTDFNRHRNPQKCCSAEVVMKNNNIKTWDELVSICGLETFQKPQQIMIHSVEVIILNEYKEEEYKYYL